MADDEGAEVEVGAEENLSAEKAREAKQLDAVTDYHEDGEIDTKRAQAVATQHPHPHTGQRLHRHPTRVSPLLSPSPLPPSAVQAINALSASDGPSAAAMRSAELSHIKVRDDDVRLLMAECELSEEEATLKLRTTNNDVKKALKDLIRV